MRTGKDTSPWGLRGQNHHSPGPQVRAVEWRRLRWVALLLTRERADAGAKIQYSAGSYGTLQGVKKSPGIPRGFSVPITDFTSFR